MFGERLEKVCTERFFRVGIIIKFNFLRFGVASEIDVKNSKKSEVTGKSSKLATNGHRKVMLSDQTTTASSPILKKKLKSSF